MSICPKCGNGTVSGPWYEKTLKGEVLRYTCRRCGYSETTPTRDAGKNRAAVELGRRGGRKGGLARAESLTPERRSEIARKAALTRWAWVSRAGSTSG